MDAPNPLLQYVDRHPQSTHEEDAELAPRARDGDEDAQNQIVLGNLRFILDFVGTRTRSDEEFMELLGVALMGALRAARRFDPDKGKFTTYSRSWIKQAIGAFRDGNLNGLEMPKRQRRLMRVIADKQEEARRTRGYALRPDELSSQDEFTSKSEPPGAETMRVLERLRGMSFRSLDAPPPGGERDNQHDLIGRKDEEVECAVTDRDILTECMEDVLSDREQLIVEQWVGFPGRGRPRSLERIGADLGFTRERARQLRNRAFRKLADHPKLRDAFRNEWGDPKSEWAA